MELKELLNVARDIRSERVGNLREYIEMVQTFDSEQETVLNILIENGVNILTAIEWVYNQKYTLWDNFVDYVDNYIDEEYNLPNFIKLDYSAMWYRYFRYNDNLYIDWVEHEWFKGGNEYGTQEEQEKYKKYIKYNISNSQLVEFYA